ncbi:MAG TPA: hypothetical protein VEF06_06720 [Bryobacteraceae bacterium]|nr:hypothetical protein [Bryobacteraceae bacterium]
MKNIRFLVAGLLLAGGLPAATPEPVQQVTYARDVAPIFREKCESCHRPG